LPAGNEKPSKHKQLLNKSSDQIFLSGYNAEKKQYLRSREEKEKTHKSGLACAFFLPLTDLIAFSNCRIGIDVI